jgi:hypothetical protein
VAFDCSDWIELLGERREARGRRTQEIAPASLLRMAGVAMELLTHSEEWNAYLQLLAARAEDCRNALVQACEALASPALVNVEALMALKIRIGIYQGMLDAFEAAMKLPAEIIAGAHASPVEPANG